MEKIARVVVLVLALAFAMTSVSFATSPIKAEMDWDNSRLTVYFSTDIHNLEPYAHIWDFVPEGKKRVTFEQSFAENVPEYSWSGGVFKTVVVFPELDGDKIVRIWGNNGKEYLYTNMNDRFAYPALNTATGKKHYDCEILVRPGQKLITTVPRGTQMDEFYAPN